MDYPVDQDELKAQLLADPDLAFEWFEKYCTPFAKNKFKGFRVGPLLKSRCDLEQLLQDIRINWWTNLLPSYDTSRCGSLEVWTCFCIRRWVITFFKSLKSKGQPLNSMLTISDTRHDDDGGNVTRTSWLENYVSDQLEDEAEQVIQEEALEKLIADLTPVLSDKEQKIFDAIIKIYLHQPWLIQHHCKVPMANIAKQLKIPPKDVDNALQRIRRKLDMLGLR